MPLVADDVVYSVLPVALRGRDRGVTCAATCAACRVERGTPGAARRPHGAGGPGGTRAPGAGMDGGPRSTAIRDHT